MFILAGLGNPGAKYARHRHNIGFMALDAIAAQYRFSPYSAKFGGLLAEGEIAGEKINAFKPQGFMNLSGEPIAALARFYKIPPSNLIVLHDDLDLKLAKIRVKLGGGNGGHNGLKSLDAHLGPDYQRIRIGIGHPGDKDIVSGYVLSDFSKEEMKTIAPLLKAMAEHMGLLVAGDGAKFMTKLSLELPKTG